MGTHIFSVEGERMLLDRKSFLPIGLRCSNALYSDQTTDSLIGALNSFRSYGLNTISVFVMGSRYSDVIGYREDASLDPVYTARLERILAATDERAMVVLVGCLYWGESRAKWTSWTQKDAEKAVQNTARWLMDRGWLNVFIDPDNEGMARARAGFDIDRLVAAAKEAAPGIPVASNYKGPPSPIADIAAHFSEKAAGKPYIETEGDPGNAPGGYWSSYSRVLAPGGDESVGTNYRNVGVYLPEMIENQKRLTAEHLDAGRGYLLASTWLQAPPPLGPNYAPGGYGSPTDPGIRWWLDFVRDRYRKA